jgi:hypothetical protein
MTIIEVFFGYSTGFTEPYHFHLPIGEDLVSEKHLEDSKQPIFKGKETIRIDEDGEVHYEVFCDRHDHNNDYGDRMNENRPYESVRWLKA